ncbi:MAG: hypothetical protein KC442_20300 [Thermomicrobiales bacterium]|nr:hypothetical protein [Thermomicrobiales bacterium]
MGNVGKQRPPGRRLAVAVSALAALLVGSVSLSPATPSRAFQDATPAATPAASPIADFLQLVAERPAVIRSGSCAEPGDPVADLTALTTPDGEARGQGTAVEAARSYTSVPIALETLLAGETHISAYLQPGSETVVACGDLGGVVSEGGSLVVKLSAEHDSGFNGIAFLGAEDAGSTGVSVFLAPPLTVAETRELAASAADATPENLPALEPTAIPTPTAEPIQVADVALLEWLIDMPAEVRAGEINFAVTNEGAQAHGLVIEGPGGTFSLPQPLAPGASTLLNATLAPGEYTVYCPEGEGEHRDEGMVLTLTVVP